jgi:hypothetical protein
MAEALIKPRYTGQTQRLWLSELQQSGTLLSKYPTLSREIETIQPGDSRLYQGRALYPRFYVKGVSDPGTEEMWNAARDYDRLSFYLVGLVNTGIVVPLDRRPYLVFPQAADVLVIGCKESGYVRALVVYIRSTQTVLVSRPIPVSISCEPPPAPK